MIVLNISESLYFFLGGGTHTTWDFFTFCCLEKTPWPGPFRCSEGSFNPLSIDVIAGPGEYVAPDGSGVLPCPVGMSCPGGGKGGNEGAWTIYWLALSLVGKERINLYIDILGIHSLIPY